tara:strand:- start:208 stop:738 length:531 start_codon:yes stop_codon:yes gene_type:complete
MIKLNNNTPFETSVTLHGKIRLISPPPEYTSIIDNPPPFKNYFTEWIYILQKGPIQKQVNLLVEPWTNIECNISSDITVNCTLGFNDIHTAWSKHSPGIYEWDSKSIGLEINCNPIMPNLNRNRRTRGPIIASDINLNINVKSDNTSWKVCEAPITTVRFIPNFNHGYYTKKPITQ